MRSPFGLATSFLAARRTVEGSAERIWNNEYGCIVAQVLEQIAAIYAERHRGFDGRVSPLAIRHGIDLADMARELSRGDRIGAHDPRLQARSAACDPRDGTPALDLLAAQSQLPRFNAEGPGPALAPNCTLQDAGKAIAAFLRDVRRYADGPRSSAAGIALASSGALAFETMGMNLLNQGDHRMAVGMGLLDASADACAVAIRHQARQRAARHSSRPSGRRNDNGRELRCEAR